jgi:hypothetical protein
MSGKAWKGAKIAKGCYGREGPEGRSGDATRSGDYVLLVLDRAGHVRSSQTYYYGDSNG